MSHFATRFVAFIVVWLLAGPALRGPLCAEPSKTVVSLPEMPDAEITAAYERAAVQNVLAAVNPKVFFGYWSVCADGQGFGYGNTYPSLDGHQMTDALLWLGQVDVVKANWDYVRSFQRPDGLLPLAIFPANASKSADPGKRASDPNNGGLYRHWVPGNPLAALADPTYVQNADVIFRHTLDRSWLSAQIKSVDLAADHLASLVTDQGRVKGAGYYVERPTRIESDGVAQCYAIDAFRRIAALHRVLEDGEGAGRYEGLAQRIEKNFVGQFWVKDHFAEYFHPERGLIAGHGLTDVDWAALATGVATPEQRAILWPQLNSEGRFHYGGMPTGIATRPETYEPWEFNHPDRHDLAAMGRVWYLEAWARAGMGDVEGLLDSVRKVCRVGRSGGYFWRERYHPDGKGGMVPAGAQKYCEYPANLIRIVQRFLLGVDLRLDGSLVLAPAATREFWDQGFGQTLAWSGRKLAYRMQRERTEGTYEGRVPLRLGLRFPQGMAPVPGQVSIDGRAVEPIREGDLVFLTLPAASREKPCRFEVPCRAGQPIAAAEGLQRLTARLPANPQAGSPSSDTADGWVKWKQNPVLGGSLGTCFDVALLREGDTLRMWFSWRPKKSLALVESKDGIHWSEPGVVLEPNLKTDWEADINRPVVLRRGDLYHLWYTGQARGRSWIGYATSPDGKRWDRKSSRPILSAERPWEKVAVMCPHVLWDEASQQFRMWYSGGEQNEPNAIGYATSRDGLNWTKHASNPIFQPDAGAAWERHKVTACQVIPHGGWHLMFYIGFRDEAHAQIGLARSKDGITGWHRHPANPVIRPGRDEWDHDACYKPFAILDQGRWLLWYNGRRGRVEQIGLATHEGEDLGF